MTDPETIIVRERLRLLAIGHYVYGGMRFLALPFFLPFLGMFAIMAAIPPEQWNTHAPRPTAQHAAASPSPSPPLQEWSRPTTRNDAPPRVFFVVILAIVGGFMFAFLALGALTAYAGRCIHKRRRPTLIYVVAGLNCLFMPYGTLLGVSTLLVLGSAAGKAEFAGEAPRLAGATGAS